MFLFFSSVFVYLETSLFRFFFVLFQLSFCMESTSYILCFRMVLFLPCDHELDFLHQLICENSINQTMQASRSPHVFFPFFPPLFFIWRCHFFRVFFCTILAFSLLYGEYVVRCFLPNGVFYLVTTGWIFDIILCNNSINQSINLCTALLMYTAHHLVKERARKRRSRRGWRRNISATFSKVC